MLFSAVQSTLLSCREIRTLLSLCQAKKRPVSFCHFTPCGAIIKVIHTFDSVAKHWKTYKPDTTAALGLDKNKFTLILEHKTLPSESSINKLVVLVTDVSTLALDIALWTLRELASVDIITITSILDTYNRFMWPAPTYPTLQDYCHSPCRQVSKACRS